MEKWTTEEIENLRIEISKKAAVDADFREKILINPKKAIEQYYGKRIPEELSIDVIENKPGIVKTFVLPNLISDSLSKEEMLAIAGGRNTTSVATVQTAVQTTTEVTTEETTSETTAEMEAEVVIAIVPVLVT